MFVERSGLPATQTLPSNRTSQVIFRAKNLRSVFLFSQATAQQESETKQNLQNKCNWVYCVCFGLWPFNLFFPVILSLFDWMGVLWPQLSKVLKPVHWAGSVPFPPVSLQRQVGCLLLWPVFISGEILHCFLVGVNKSYVIATSDLWLFIHASNLLPSLPTLLPNINNANSIHSSLMMRQQVPSDEADYIPILLLNQTRIVVPSTSQHCATSLWIKRRGIYMQGKIVVQIVLDMLFSIWGH